MKIYLDMDGVIADFEKRYRDVTGYTMYQDIVWDALGEHKHDIYAKLEPMEDARELVDGVIELANQHGYTVHILSAIPQKGGVDLAAQHKLEWTQKHFPELYENFNIGPFARDKWKWCKLDTDILIDDMVRNINQWNDAGGVGIYHTNANTTLNKLQEVLKG